MLPPATVQGPPPATGPGQPQRDGGQAGRRPHQGRSRSSWEARGSEAGSPRSTCGSRPHPVLPDLVSLGLGRMVRPDRTWTCAQGARNLLGGERSPLGGRGGAQTGAPLAAVAPSVPVGGGHHVSTPFPPELPPPRSRPPHPVPPTAPQVLSGPQTCSAATPLPSSGPGASLSGAPHPVFGEGQPPLLWPLGQA